MATLIDHMYNREWAINNSLILYKIDRHNIGATIINES